MTGDAAHISTFGHPSRKADAFRVLVQSAIRQVLHPEPILIVCVVSSFTSEHHSHSGQMLGRISDDLINIHGTDSRVVCVSCGNEEPRHVGQDLYDGWRATGMSAPEVMTETRWCRLPGTGEDLELRSGIDSQTPNTTCAKEVDDGESAGAGQ